ncbi:MAG TPA: hypothetical protein PKC28_08860, partial [Bdellovibrionales bacterium]|nr:hypothetical protein [Bdellovibrionales bacterium]
MVVRALLLCVSVLGLAACSGKPSERRVHENQPGSFAEAPMSKTEAKGQIGALYAKRAETAKRLKEAKNGADALAIAKELGAVVLNTTVLATPEFSGTPEFDVVLGQFHAALDKAFKLDRKAVEESGILARYEDVVLAFCNENNEGCVRLKIFKGDQLAGRILMHVAETLETGMVAARDQRDALIMRKEPNSRIGEATRALQTIVIRFYRLLQLAYEMGNGTANPDLDRKYVTYASAYFEYFRALPEDQKQNEFHRRHRDVMTLALGHMRNQSNTTGLSKVYCDFLIKLNPLDPNAFAALDLDRRAQLSMTNEFITCTGTGKAKTLKKMIEVVLQKQNAAAKVKFEEDAKNPKSVLTVQSEGYGYAMAALADTPYLYNGLNAKLTPRADLPFFIVDRVYYQQLDLNSALAYWQRAENVDEIEFLEFVRNYARVQIAYVIKVTQKNYARVFEERFAQRNSIGADFFQDVIKEVNGTMQSDWTDVRERQYMIRELLIRLFDAKYGRTVDQSRQKVQREYLNLKAELNNLPHLISMSTTVPMAIPLHYYMSKVQGAIKILVNWWNSTSKYFDIVAVNAVDRLLTGDSTTQAAFFEFGRVYYRFDHLEKLHVFDLALRTGLFDAINFALLEEDKALNMDPEALFFKEATKSALGSFEGSFRIAIDELEKVATSADFKQVLIGAC